MLAPGAQVEPLVPARLLAGIVLVTDSDDSPPIVDDSRTDPTGDKSPSSEETLIGSGAREWLRQQFERIDRVFDVAARDDEAKR